MHDFTGSVAVVTGAGSGAGRALAHACAADGMRVVVADIDGDAGEAVAAEIREGGGEAIAVATDIADRASVDALGERIRAEFGGERSGLVLFQNAGVMKTTPLAEATSEDWQWILAVNIWGVINSVQAFLPLLREQEGPAQIVITASMSGLVARQNVNGVYTASKHAVVGYANVLRDELEPEGIGVSCWCPSGMATQIRNTVRVRQPRYGGPPGPDDTVALPRIDALPPEAFIPRVLQGARENRRYIFSHPAARAVLHEYYETMFADYDEGERIARELG